MAPFKFELHQVQRVQQACSLMISKRDKSARTSPWEWHLVEGRIFFRLLAAALLTFTLSGSYAAELQFNITWSNVTDIDLHVKDPSGEEIYYQHGSSASGGVYSGDVTVGTGPENITWNVNAPVGTYTFWAVNYTGGAAVTWNISIFKNGNVIRQETGALLAVRGTSSIIFSYTHANSPPPPLPDDSGDPVRTKDNNPCCGNTNVKSADPIFYGTGEIDYFVDDLTSSGFKPLSIRRSYSQRRLGVGQFGPDWVSDLNPIIVRRTVPLVEVRLGANSSLIFIEDNNAGAGVVAYTPLRYNREELRVAGNDLLFADMTGNRVLFYGFGTVVPANQRGKIKQSIDEAGNSSAFIYNTSGLVSNIVRVGGGAQESFDFVYRADGLVTSVSRSIIRDSVTTVSRSVAYTYYTGAVGEYGNANQLKLVEIKNASGTVLTRYHYRYWRNGDKLLDGSPSSGQMLKFVISTGAYDRMAQAGLDPLTASNIVLANYADKYWEYTNSFFGNVSTAFPRVSHQTIRGNEIDGTGTQKFLYYKSEHPNGYNNWKTFTQEILADNTINNVYCNYASQVLLKTTTATNDARSWVHLYRYDNEGREILHVTPSAIATGYSWPSDADQSDPYLGFGATGGATNLVKSTDGLIIMREYYPSTTATATVPGGVAGRFWKETARKGYNGTSETIKEATYLLRSGN